MHATSTRIQFGDWQTPEALAQRVVACVMQHLTPHPQTVLEPTCGKGSFLSAAARQLPQAALIGYDINPEYVALAKSRIESSRLSIRQADFFSVNWEEEIARLRGPILVLGNPPWVTSAELGSLRATNLPSKRNFKGLLGLDALTGKSNFDVSEWMILRLLEVLTTTDATLAMLCKSAVARRVVEFSARQGWGVRPGAVWRVDAGRHFNAAVDAVLFVAQVSRGRPASSVSWPVYASLEASATVERFGIEGGSLVADPDAYRRTKSLAGRSDPAWRSGLKHDCARVMELQRHGQTWINGEDEIVDIESDFLYPLLKSSDIANGRLRPERSVIVPQRSLGEDTESLRERAPKLWAYLTRHRHALDARKSSIYRGQPPFSLFGIGDYAFAPWKIAISGLYKRLRFSLVGPEARQPVMLDDTCYFLPYWDEPEARRVTAALDSAHARDFFRGRIFWDSKRPISKAVLQALDIQRLMRALDWGDGTGHPVQQSLEFSTI